MSHASSIIHYVGNSATESYRLFIDRILTNDICFTPYDEHHQT